MEYFCSPISELSGVLTPEWLHGSYKNWPVYWSKNVEMRGKDHKSELSDNDYSARYYRSANVHEEANIWMHVTQRWPPFHLINSLHPNYDLYIVIGVVLPCRVSDTRLPTHVKRARGRVEKESCYGREHNSEQNYFIRTDREPCSDTRITHFLFQTGPRIQRLRGTT